MAKNNSKNIHAQRMKAIRPHVNFNIDMRRKLTTAQKRKIKKYYDEFNALTARPFTPVAPRNKKNMATAKRYAGQNTGLTGFKVAFIPSSGEKKLDLKFDAKGRMTVKAKYVSSQLIEFDDFDELMDNPTRYIKELLTDVDAENFSIAVGREGMYEIPHIFNKGRGQRSVFAKVEYLLNRYDGSAGSSKNGKGRSDARDWLFGLRARTFHNQSDIGAYMKEKSAARQSLRRNRRNKVRRDKRARKK